MPTVPSITVASIAPVPVAPPCVHDFVCSAAQVPGVQCIVAEDHDGSCHITTFVSEITEADRATIYGIEYKTIERYPGNDFDFHVRLASDALGPGIANGKYFFAVWGELGGK